LAAGGCDDRGCGLAGREREEREEEDSRGRLSFASWCFAIAILMGGYLFRLASFSVSAPILRTWLVLRPGHASSELLFEKLRGDVETPAYWATPSRASKKYAVIKRDHEGTVARTT
jgi:hypothetical protein